MFIITQNDKSKTEVAEPVNSEFRNAVHDAVMLTNSRDSARLVGYKCDVINGGISMKAEALEPDLFEQSVQMKR